MELGFILATLGSFLAMLGLIDLTEEIEISKKKMIKITNQNPMFIGGYRRIFQNM